jgi:hypothetical protein
MFDRAGAMSQLNGTPVDQLAIADLNGSTNISMQSLVEDYDPTGPLDPVAIPVEVSVDAGNLPSYFAIAVNGTIKTVVSANLVDGGVATIYAFVPPGSFVAGPNTVEVFGVVGTESAVSLVRYG